MRIFLGIFCLICVTTVSIFWVRGTKSTKPPIYIFPDMDWQAKYKPQGENAFFPDKRDARPVVPGTIVRGNALKQKQVFEPDYAYEPALHPAIYTGKNADGSFYSGFPIPITHSLLEQGQRKFNIYCAACHNITGDGNGVTKQYGMVATVSYHDDRIRQMPEGEIFNTITYGKNTMLGYGDKLTPEERWAVVAYVRALQLAACAPLSAVPLEHRADLGL